MKLEQSFRMRLRDVLVLKVTQLEDGEEEELKNLAGNLSGLCAIPIIVLQEGMTLDSLSEQDMVKAGWMRVERRNDA